MGELAPFRPFFIQTFEYITILAVFEGLAQRTESEGNRILINIKDQGLKVYDADNNRLSWDNDGQLSDPAQPAA